MGGQALLLELEVGVGGHCRGSPVPLLQGGLPGDLLALTSPGCVEGRAGFLQALSLLFFPPLPSLSQEGCICPLMQSPRLHPVAGVISGVDLRGWPTPPWSADITNCPFCSSPVPGVLAPVHPL